MLKFPLIALASAALLIAAHAAEYQEVPGWTKLPEGRSQIGNMHGDIAVASNGEIYASVMDPKAAVQVYAPDGKFLRVVPNAPADFHGFIIHRDADGVEYIYGPRLGAGNIVKLTLDGQEVLNIPPSAIPEEFKNKNQEGKGTLALTGIAVGPNGDIYVTDGYASDYIHRFDKTGKYLQSFGGKKAPYNFNNLHKIAIDPRFDPVRLIASDRANKRVVHLSLDGELLGVVATDLRLPSAFTFFHDEVVVAELNGRVTILDKDGKIVTSIGTDETPGEPGSNRTEPDHWKVGIVTAPHGVACDEKGDIYVCEYNIFGRIHRFDRQ